MQQILSSFFKNMNDFTYYFRVFNINVLKWKFQSFLFIDKTAKFLEERLLIEFLDCTFFRSPNYGFFLYQRVSVLYNSPLNICFK